MEPADIDETIANLAAVIRLASENEFDDELQAARKEACDLLQTMLFDMSATDGPQRAALALRLRRLRQMVGH